MHLTLYEFIRMSGLIAWDAINFYVIAKFINKKACKLQAFLF